MRGVGPLGRRWGADYSTPGSCRPGSHPAPGGFGLRVSFAVHIGVPLLPPPHLHAIELFYETLRPIRCFTYTRGLLTVRLSFGLSQAPALLYQYPKIRRPPGRAQPKCGHSPPCTQLQPTQVRSLDAWCSTIV